LHPGASAAMSPSTIMRFVLRLLVLVTLAIHGRRGPRRPLPFMTEGGDIEEVWLLGGLAPVLAFLGYCWWRRTRGAPVFRTLGLVVLALPLTVHLVLTSTLAGMWLTARVAERRLRIHALRERPIHWMGIADPVGLSLDIDLEHSLAADGILYAQAGAEGGSTASMML
jgi:hypothetical protein